ncbi:MAG: DUF1289 domain-containing protein [Pseudomonadota bacterium]|nr:DUF1289 domain-containing protein [Pseudomonadota bacterium]
MCKDFYVTPCQSICKINTDSRTCIGCGRTMEEISLWSSYSHDERMVIMKRLGYGIRKKRNRKRSLS